MFTLQDYYYSLNENDEIVEDEVVVRFNGDNVMVKKNLVNFVDVAPSQVVSITTSFTVNLPSSNVL